MKMLYSLVLSVSLLLSSFSIDFSQLSQVLFNDEEIIAIKYNDELVWLAIVPFTLNLRDYPISKTGSGGAVIMTNCYGPYTITCDGGDCDWTYRWVSASTGVIPTNGCNKVKVTYYTLHNHREDSKMYINGVDVSRKGTSSSQETLILDCSETFTLTMRCESSSYGADLIVTGLYFYYE